LSFGEAGEERKPMRARGGGGGGARARALPIEHKSFSSSFRSSTPP
jgi:hypothetical protein